MAQRLVRAKTQDPAGGHLTGPPPGRGGRAGRLGGVLRVVYLVFTAGPQTLGRWTPWSGATCVTRRSGWPRGAGRAWSPARPR